MLLFLHTENVPIDSIMNTCLLSNCLGGSLRYAQFSVDRSLFNHNNTLAIKVNEAWHCRSAVWWMGWDGYLILIFYTVYNNFEIGMAGRLTLSGIYEPLIPSGRYQGTPRGWTGWGEMVEKVYGGQNFPPSKIWTMSTFLRLLSTSKWTLKCPSNHHSILRSGIMYS